MVQQLPDAEVLFRTWALAQSEISSLVGTRIATRLPNGGTLPFLVVAQLGGAPSADEALIYEANLFIDAYGGKYGSTGTKGQPDYASAYDLAAKTIANTFDFTTPRKYTSSGGEVGTIHGFFSQSGPTRIEEPELGLARYNIEVVMIYGASS